MAPDWQTKHLADLIEIRHGFAFSGAYISEDPAGDVLLTPGNFAIGGGFKGGRFKYYTGPVPQEFVLNEGDLLVTMTDLSKQTDTLGYPAFVPPPQAGRQYLHNQRLGKVVARPEAPVDLRYLYYVLCSAPYRHEILAGATGTTVKHTSPKRIGQFRFPLPPISEQRAISSILSVLDDKIELNRRMSETLEDIAATVFHSWFVAFDDAEHLEDSDLGLIPEGWQVEPIGNLIHIVGGSTPSTKEPNYWDGGSIPWATPKDLSGHEGPVLLETARCITDAGLERISSGLLPKGTLLFSSRAPIGYRAIAGQPTAVNQGFIAVPPGGDLSPTYMYFWAHSNLDVIRGHAGGSTFAEVSKRSFRSIQALLPPMELRLRFDEVAGLVLRRCELLARESKALAELRDALLPKLISGELRVPDAEQLVSEVA